MINQIRVEKEKNIKVWLSVWKKKVFIRKSIFGYISVQKKFTFIITDFINYKFKLPLKKYNIEKHTRTEKLLVFREINLSRSFMTYKENVLLNTLYIIGTLMHSFYHLVFIHFYRNKSCAVDFKLNLLCQMIPWICIVIVVSTTWAIEVYTKREHFNRPTR